MRTRHPPRAALFYSDHALLEWLWPSPRHRIGARATLVAAMMAKPVRVARPPARCRNESLLGRVGGRWLSDPSGFTEGIRSSPQLLANDINGLRTETVGFQPFSLQRLTPPGTDADDAQWHSLAKLPKLAFDHPEIIAAARQALIARLDREPLALALLPPRFTLTQLQKVYEAIEGHPLDKRNFRRSILAKNWIRETGDMERGNRRPAMLYEGA